MQSLTRGRPSGSPAARSSSSIASSRRRRRAARRARRAGRRRPRRSRPSRGAARRSSSSSSTVSVASFLFVPMTPLGPRLIQPATYTPGPRTRPPSFGIVAAALVERDAGERDAAVADAAEDEPARERLALVGRRRAAARRVVEHVPDELDALDAIRRRGSRPGDAKNRSTTRFGLPLGSRAANSRSTSRLRSRVRVASARRPRGRPGRRSRRRRRARRAPAAPAS